MPEENRAIPYVNSILNVRDQLEAKKSPLPGALAVPPGLLAIILLSIDKVEPAVPIQGKPVQVSFSLTNISGNTVSGTVSTSGLFGGQTPIANLASGTTFTGSLTSVAPKASKGVQLTLQFFKKPVPEGVEFPPADAEDTNVVDIISGYILEVAQDWFHNPAYDIRSAGQAAQVCHNRTAFDAANITASNPTLEWAPILTPNDEAGGNVGASGWACSINTKAPTDFHADVPFLHPFYNDWTFYLALDPPYESLLGPGNKISSDTGAQDAKTYADSNGIPVPLIDNEESFLEVEMEQGLASSLEYWPMQGERVAVFGRWIVDCGHNNYSTEIHPPLLLAVGRQSGEETLVKVLGRAFLTSQHFGNDTLLQHMFKDLLVKEAEAAAALLFPPALAAIPAMEARPPIISPPFSGIPIMAFTARPPQPRSSPSEELRLSYHFTVRNGVSVTVVRGSSYPDEVVVIVTMNTANYNPAKLPPKQEIAVPITGFDPNDPNVKVKPSDVFGASIAANPAVAVVLGKGVKTDRYNLPPTQSSHDAENVITDWIVDRGIPSSVASTVSVDDNQPYPIYGWLTLRWSASAPVTDVASGVAGVGDNVYFFAKSLDGRVFYNRAKLGEGGVGWAEVEGNGRISSAPAAAGVGTHVFLVAQGLDGNLYLNQADLGRPFNNFWLNMR